VAAVRRSRLTEKDRQDWALFARQIKPMPGKTLPELPPAPVAAPVAAPVERPIPPPPDKPAPALKQRPAMLAVGEHPGGLDNSSWNRFRSGKLGAVRTLDLHGRTAQRAYHALHSFLLAAHADHVRCVEVITGRGSGENGGVIRRELPLWLNLPTLRPLVLAATHPHPANPGSVRLLLRRPK
jgi:DNA-nicking Smr family endonuclease